VTFMFGSCRFCNRPTDKWQDFCNECAVLDSPPKLRVITGGKTEWERPGRKPPREYRWLQEVPRPRPYPRSTR